MANINRMAQLGKLYAAGPIMVIALARDLHLQGLQEEAEALAAE